MQRSLSQPSILHSKINYRIRRQRYLLLRCYMVLRIFSILENALTFYSILMVHFDSFDNVFHAYGRQILDSENDSGEILCFDSYRFIVSQIFFHDENYISIFPDFLEGVVLIFGRRFLRLRTIHVFIGVKI